MSKRELTKEIEMALEYHKTGSEIFINEFSLKTDRYTLIYDGMNLNLKTKIITGFEVKISKSDFNTLWRKLMDVSNNYDYFVDKFYVVVPKELEKFALLQLKTWTKEVAYISAIGLKVYDTETGNFVIKKLAKQNNRIRFDKFIRPAMIQDVKDTWIRKNMKKRK